MVCSNWDDLAIGIEQIRPIIDWLFLGLAFAYYLAIAIGIEQIRPIIDWLFLGLAFAYYLFYKLREASQPVFKEPTHSQFATLEIIHELFESNEIGLWEIIKHARMYYPLIDNDLIEQIRQGALLYLRAGFEPVIAAEAGRYGWQLVNYGSTDEEKASSIVREWLDAGKDPMFWDSLWFSPTEHIISSSDKEALGCTNTSKTYPGTVYELPDSIHLGVRQSNIGVPVIEIFEPYGYAHGAIDGIYWGMQWLNRGEDAIETLGPVSAHGSIVCTR